MRPPRARRSFHSLRAGAYRPILGCLRPRRALERAVDGGAMNIDRLLSIVIILLNKDLQSASELARRFSVSVRTIQRDMDTLNLAGIPIYAMAGQAGGMMGARPRLTACSASSSTAGSLATTTG